MVTITNEKSRPTTTQNKAELVDTLIAINVVAKRLAEKLRQKEIDKKELMKATDEVIFHGEAFMAEATKFIECIGIMLTTAKALRVVLDGSKEDDHV